MARELGGSQISALLESVPGIVNVLRSPVADALVNTIRAGAGLEAFELASAEELIQYAVRRGLIGASEGDEVLADVRSVVRKGRKKRGSGGKARAGAGRKKSAGQAGQKSVKKAGRPKKAARKKAAKKASRSSRAKGR